MDKDAEILFAKIKAFQSDTQKHEERKKTKKEIFKLTEEYVDRLTELFARHRGSI